MKLTRIEEPKKSDNSLAIVFVAMAAVAILAAVFITLVSNSEATKFCASQETKVEKRTGSVVVCEDILGRHNWTYKAFYYRDSGRCLYDIGDIVRSRKVYNQIMGKKFYKGLILKQHTDGKECTIKVATDDWESIELGEAWVYKP